MVCWFKSKDQGFCQECLGYLIPRSFTSRIDHVQVYISHDTTTIISQPRNMLCIKINVYF